MPIYDFTLPAAAAGLPYTVTDSHGVEIATGTLGSVTDDHVLLQLTISTGDGHYFADAGRSAHHEHFIVEGEVNEFASFTEAGGGSSLDLSGSTRYVGEVTAPFDIAQTTQVGIVFDTITPAASLTPQGDPLPSNFYSMPEGVYAVAIEVDFSAPPADRFAAVRLKGLNGINGTTDVNVGPSLIASDGNNYTGRTLFGSGIISGNGFAMTMAHTARSGEASPPNLGVDYLWMSLTKIG